MRTPLNKKFNEQNNDGPCALENLVHFSAIENNNVKWPNLALTAERESFQIYRYIPDSVSW